MKLKGHSKIELTDVNTGEVTIREQDNIFTNAIPNIYAHVYFDLGCIPRAAATDGIKNWLGGIMLFDSAIDEDPDITMCPAGTKCVGHAAQDAYAGSDSYRGSVNSTETSITDTGATYVWDFATNQGNGTIACLALTSEIGGVCGYGCSSSSSSSSSGPVRYYSYALGSLYSYSSDSYCPTLQYKLDGVDYWAKALFGTGGITLSRYTFDNKSTGWNNRIFNTMMLDKTVTDGTYTASSDGIEMYRAGEDNGYLYWFYVQSSALYVVEVSKDFDTVNVYKSSTYGVVSQQGLNIVYNGLLYSLYSPSIIYISDFKNGTKDSISLTDQGISAVPYIYTQYCPTWVVGDKIFFGNIVLDTSDNTVLYSTPYYYYYSSPTYYYYYYFLDEVYSPTGFCVYGNYRAFYSAIAMNYLATINNLETPVTKTSAQTMKITYTVTVED